MMPDDPLSQLRDIHLPQAGGFWPPAPGWWILAVTLLVIILLLAWLAYRQQQKNRWLRLARAELRTLEHTASQDPHWFMQVNELLKRTARARYPNEHPEVRTGEDWVAFLLRYLPEDSNSQRPVAEALVTSTWQPEPAADPAQALTFARVWLEAQKC